jgi:hypothetical protein
MNRQQVFSYHLWRELQGEEKEEFLGVKIEGMKEYTIWKLIPERDLYHISVVILGKCIDVIYKRGSLEGNIIKRRQRW